MAGDPELDADAAWMRQDWDRRAIEDAEHYIYTRDSGSDVAGFLESGRANYDQLVRPYLPVLLDGRAARNSRALEIGCGAGRMTRWFAEDFAAVDALDISEEMLERARTMVAEHPNVRLCLGSGVDLAGLPEESYDLAFSYIVFQHVPSRAVVERYARDAARVLKDGGCFKFQVNGDQSPEYVARRKDTWQGETFSLAQAREMLEGAGFTLLAAEGAGTQYFVLTARKGAREAERGPRSYILPGEAWAEAQLLEGWHDPVEGSWRPVEARASARLRMPLGDDRRVFAGVYLWPGDDFRPTEMSLFVGGELAGRVTEGAPGDQYLEFALPQSVGEGTLAVVTMTFEPPPTKHAALRILGTYDARRA